MEHSSRIVDLMRSEVGTVSRSDLRRGAAAYVGGSSEPMEGIEVDFDNSLSGVLGSINSRATPKGNQFVASKAIANTIHTSDSDSSSSSSDSSLRPDPDEQASSGASSSSLSSESSDSDAEPPNQAQSATDIDTDAEDSESDFDADSDSSSSDSSGPPEIASSKRARINVTQANKPAPATATPTAQPNGAPAEPPRPKTPPNGWVPPGQGMSKTRKRNQKRRENIRARDAALAAAKSSLQASASDAAQSEALASQKPGQQHQPETGFRPNASNAESVVEAQVATSAPLPPGTGLSTSSILPFHAQPTQPALSFGGTRIPAEQDLPPGGGSLGMPETSSEATRRATVAKQIPVVATRQKRAADATAAGSSIGGSQIGRIPKGSFSSERGRAEPVREVPKRLRLDRRDCAGWYDRQWDAEVQQEQQNGISVSSSTADVFQAQPNGHEQNGALDDFGADAYQLVQAKIRQELEAEKAKENAETIAQDQTTLTQLREWNMPLSFGKASALPDSFATGSEITLDYG